MIVHLTNQSETLSQALALMDPTGMLVPGTREYDTIQGMIRGWVDQYGPEDALQMARIGATHLKRWQKFL